MAKTKTFRVHLPDGKTDIRKSTHEYRYAVVVRSLGRGKTVWGEWGVWRYSEKIESAQAYAKYLQNCPSAKLGDKFETQIVSVETETQNV